MGRHVSLHVFHRSGNSRGKINFQGRRIFLFFFQAKKIFNFGGKSAKVRIVTPRFNVIEGWKTLVRSLLLQECLSLMESKRREMISTAYQLRSS